MLSISRWRGLMAGIVVLVMAWQVITLVRAGRAGRWRQAFSWRRWVKAPATVGALLLWLVIGALWTSRPRVRLTGVLDSEVVFEIHSHTNASPDAAAWPASRFDLPANLAWHRAAGFDLVFITDHNTVAAGFAQLSQPEMETGLAVPCRGIEISSYRSHILILGSELPNEPARYRGSEDRLRELLAVAASRPDIISISSLPEHRGRTALHADLGVEAIEIVNASPKGNETQRDEMSEFIAVAKKHNLAMVAAGDAHGYGATTMAWNIIRSEGWRMSPGQGCGAVIEALARGGGNAVQILQRGKLANDSRWPWIATPLAVVITTWRSMPQASLPGWVIWIWMLGWLRRRRETDAAALP